MDPPDRLGCAPMIYRAHALTWVRPLSPSDHVSRRLAQDEAFGTVAYI